MTSMGKGNFSYASGLIEISSATSNLGGDFLRLRY